MERSFSGVEKETEIFKVPHNMNDIEKQSMGIP